MNQVYNGTSNLNDVIRLSPDMNTSEAEFSNFIGYLDAEGAFDHIDGIAANAYEGAGGKTMSQVVQELKDLGFANNIYITEFGIDPYADGDGKLSRDPENYAEVMAEIEKLMNDPAIRAMMAFNPLPGLNNDWRYDKHEYTDEQYDSMVAMFDGTGTTPDVAETPARVVVAQVPVVSQSDGGGGGGSCTGFSQKNVGALDRSGGNTCCRGDSLSVCFDSSGNGYIESKSGSDDHDADYCIDGGGVNRCVDDGSSAEYLGGAIGDNHENIGPVQRELCVRNHASTYKEHDWMCITRGGGNVGVSPGEGQGQTPKFDLVSKAHAQSEQLDPGVYSVTGINVDVTTLSVDVVHPGTLSFFYDDNGNGTFDSGEQYLTDQEAAAVEVELNKETDILHYDLSPGWNSLAFPQYMEGEEASQVLIASELAAYLKASSVDATHIAAYRGGVFLIYSLRTDTSGGSHAYGIDFGIVPGEGYFIKSSTGGEIALAGQKIAGSLPIYLNAGWNLVGYYNGNESSLSAIGLLSDMQDNSVPADIISKWENSKYISVVNDGGNEYGLDFQVYPKYSYWTRVDNDTEFVNGIYSP